MSPSNNAPDFQLPSTDPQQSNPANDVRSPEFVVPADPMQSSGDTGQPSGVMGRDRPDNDAMLVKQTVAQLKETLQKTANDPYAQVKAVENLKAAYLQARFGRSIKVAEE
jgi:hypothetical protein